MSEKIKWYKEVLALEPNSKVFFPLSRMLAEEQNVAEAIDVLRHGLERHQEFLEARLYLIELLFNAGQLDDCTSEIEKLNAMFATYAGFWQAWATVAAVKNSPDVSVIIRLLAASFNNNKLTLHDVLEQGLGGVSNLAQTAPNQDSELLQNVTTNDVDVQEQSIVASEADAGMEMPETVPDIEQSEDNEEPFTLRTRSMAEVLAEQGDTKGALDIYQELMATAATEEEKTDLAQRVAALQNNLLSPTQDVAEQEILPAGKDKLINMLENLAARVEARAQN